MKNHILLVIAVIAVFAGRPATGQNGKDVMTQRLIWFGYHNKFRFNDSWMIVTEIEDRWYVFPGRHSEWVLPRIALIRESASGWNTGLGFAHFRQSAPERAESDVSYVRPEFRPHLEASHISKPGERRFSIDHRYKVEGRFIRKTLPEGLAGGYTFHVRVRYRMQVSCFLVKTESGQGTLTAKMYDEIMVNFGKNILYNLFDQNRLGVALNYGLKKGLQFQVDFLNVFKERNGGSQYFNQYVERLTVYHTIDRKGN